MMVATVVPAEKAAGVAMASAVRMDSSAASGEAATLAREDMVDQVGTLVMAVRVVMAAT